MTKRKYNHTAIVCTAIGVIGVLEAIALFKGIDGVMLTTVLVIVAGLAGWVAPQLKLVK